MRYATIIIAVAILLVIGITGCGSSNEPSVDTTTTVEVVPEVSTNDVEASFQYQAQKFGDRLSNQNGTAIEVDDVRCTNVDNGKGTCYVNFTVIVDGYYEQKSSAAWNITYDEQTAKIITYIPVGKGLGAAS